MNNENQGRELSWDDQIELDSQEFILLEEGDYDFKIEKYERARSQGSGKLPVCNMAIVFFTIESAKGNTTVTENYILHSSLEWKLSELFAAIGLKKKGERISMNWSQIPGAFGRANIIVDTYQNKDGEERKINRIKKLYPREEEPQKKFKAGAF